jgi:hypothetical protein
MAELKKMPPVTVPPAQLKAWGQTWLGTTNNITGKTKQTGRFDRQQSTNFASFIDKSFATSLAVMLGDVPLVASTGNALIPSQEDCVEYGKIRVIGGIRPQNYDVAYRPDGPRIVFDSKTLNDLDSVRKNWQNMVNDLGTEATTVHTRFPYALVIFMVVIPADALGKKQEQDIIRTLERLATRKAVIDQPHLVEACSFIVWNPADGTVHPDIPPQNSHLRIEKVHTIIEPIYLDRYKGLPPHSVTDEEQDGEDESEDKQKQLALVPAQTEKKAEGLD